MSSPQSAEGSRSRAKRAALGCLLAGLLFSLQTCTLLPRAVPNPLPIQITDPHSPTPFQPLAAGEATQDTWTRYLEPSPSPGSPTDPDPDSALEPTGEHATTSDQAHAQATQTTGPVTLTPTASPTGASAAQASLTHTARPLLSNTPSMTPIPPSSTPTQPGFEEQTATPVPASMTPTWTTIPPTPTDTDALACVVTGDAAFESSLFALINQERTNRGLPALVTRNPLTAAARVHSRDMACEDFLSHTGSDGSSPADRVAAQGYDFSALGENIYAGSGPYNSPQQAFQAWMDSPGHRANMLNSTYTSVGIGYRYNQDSTYGAYVTAVFTSP